MNGRKSKAQRRMARKGMESFSRQAGQGQVLGAGLDAWAHMNGYTLTGKVRERRWRKKRQPKRIVVVFTVVPK